MLISGFVDGPVERSSIIHSFEFVIKTGLAKIKQWCGASVLQCHRSETLHCSTTLSLESCPADYKSSHNVGYNILTVCPHIFSICCPALKPALIVVLNIATVVPNLLYLAIFCSRTLDAVCTHKKVQIFNYQCLHCVSTQTVLRTLVFLTSLKYSQFLSYFNLYILNFLMKINTFVGIIVLTCINKNPILRRFFLSWGQSMSRLQSP